MKTVSVVGLTVALSMSSAFGTPSTPPRNGVATIEETCPDGGPTVRVALRWTARTLGEAFLDDVDIKVGDAPLKESERQAFLSDMRRWTDQGILPRLASIQCEITPTVYFPMTRTYGHGHPSDELRLVLAGDQRRLTARRTRGSDLVWEPATTTKIPTWREQILKQDSPDRRGEQG